MSRQRILDAAMREFSARGYEGASLNTVCTEYGISKGIIYHYFKDKDELYLLCTEKCFNEITAYLEETAKQLSGTVEQKLQTYFDARLCFLRITRCILVSLLMLRSILQRLFQQKLRSAGRNLMN